jgi:hypothetical protein
MIDQPGSPDQYRWVGRVRSAAAVPGRTIAVGGVLAALVVGILIGRELGTSGPAALASPSASTVAVGTPATSGTSSFVPASPTPTGLPALAISGELPPPNAPLPPGTPVIPGLSLVAVASTAISLGFTCDSGRKPSPFDSGPPLSAYFWLRCERLSAATNSRDSVSADYATLDSVSDVHVSIGATIDLGRSMPDPDVFQVAQRTLAPFAELIPQGKGPRVAALRWIRALSCTGYPNCTQASWGVAVLVLGAPDRDDRDLLPEPGMFIYPAPSGPSPIPSPSVIGILPPPDARVPPGATAIPNLKLRDLLATAASLGFTCDSEYYALGVGFYHLVCEAKDTATNASYTLEAEYWTLDAVGHLDVRISSIDYGLPILDPTATERMLLPFATLAGGDAARDWVQLKMDDPTCRGGVECTTTIAGVRYDGAWGRQVWSSIFLSPAGS